MPFDAVMTRLWNLWPGVALLMAILLNVWLGARKRQSASRAHRDERAEQCPTPQPTTAPGIVPDARLKPPDLKKDGQLRAVSADGWAVRKILERGTDEVIYTDPDGKYLTIECSTAPFDCPDCLKDCLWKWEGPDRRGEWVEVERRSEIIRRVKYALDFLRPPVPGLELVSHLEISARIREISSTKLAFENVTCDLIQAETLRFTLDQDTVDVPVIERRSGQFAFDEEEVQRIAELVGAGRMQHGAQHPQHFTWMLLEMFHKRLSRPGPPIPSGSQIIE